MTDTSSYTLCCFFIMHNIYVLDFFCTFVFAMKFTRIDSQLIGNLFQQSNLELHVHVIEMEYYTYQVFFQTVQPRPL